MTRVKVWHARRAWFMLRGLMRSTLVLLPVLFLALLFACGKATNGTCEESNDCAATADGGSDGDDTTVTSDGGSDARDGASASDATDEADRSSGPDAADDSSSPDASALPVVSALSQTGATINGGTAIALSGSGFALGMTSTLGAVVVQSASSATITVSSALTPGPQSFDVTTSSGSSAPFAFTILPHPGAPSVAPTSGPVATPQVATVTSSSLPFGLSGVPFTITVGGLAMANVAATAATKATGTIPSGGTAGPVNVVVTVDGVSSTGTGAYTFATGAAVAPTVATVLPLSSQDVGGYTHTITGTGFITGMTVTVGAAAPVKATVLSTTRATFTGPPFPGSSISEVTITNAGTGYAAAPLVTFTGGGGTGATATCQVYGGIVSIITITNGGTGYTSPPTVTFSGGGGSGETGTAVLNTGTITPQRVTVATSGGSASLPNLYGGGGIVYYPTGGVTFRGHYFAGVWTTSGNIVLSWTDLTGNGDPGSGAGSVSPAIVANYYNGLPAASYDGATQISTFTFGTAPSNASGTVLGLVIQEAGETAQTLSVPFQCQHGADLEDVYLEVPASGNSQREHGFGTLNGYLKLDYSPLTTAPESFIGALSHAGTDSFVWYLGYGIGGSANGGSYASGTLDAPVNPFDGVASLGGLWFNTSAEFFFDGDIMEAFVLDGTYTQAQARAAGLATTATWGVNVAP